MKFKEVIIIHGDVYLAICVKMNVAPLKSTNLSVANDGIDIVRKNIKDIHILIKDRISARARPKQFSATL